MLRFYLWKISCRGGVEGLAGRQNFVIFVLQTTMTRYSYRIPDGIFAKIRPDVAFLLVGNCKGSACGSVACLKHYIFPSGMGGGGEAVRRTPHGPQMDPTWTLYQLPVPIWPRSPILSFTL